jgi:hypothetical protein
MILAVVATLAAVTACSKKSSLYLEPGRMADAPKPPAAAPAAAPLPAQKTSEVETANR